jgi:voltage-dependent potassium channel beta subunit
MHYRRLGRSGLKVSEISLGSWVTFGSQIDEGTAIEIFREAYDQGVNYFDNADIYANGQAEAVMGKAIKGLPREALVLSSKVFWATMPGPNGRGLSRKHIMESVNASLKRLGTDYLDLYICHRFDPDTPIDEIIYTMDILVRQGKVLYWGTSEWRAWQLTAAFLSAKDNHLTPPTVEQPQYNMFHRHRVEAELAQVIRDYGIGLMTWSPLYYGILTGKYNDGIPSGSRACWRVWPGSAIALPPRASPLSASWARSRKICTSPPPSWPSPGCCVARTSAAWSAARPVSSRLSRTSKPPST